MVLSSVICRKWRDCHTHQTLLSFTLDVNLNLGAVRSTEKKYVQVTEDHKWSNCYCEGQRPFHDIHAEVRSGRKRFSMTTKDAVTAYLEHREVDVNNGTIVVGRYGTITAHLITSSTTSNGTCT